MNPQTRSLIYFISGILALAGAVLFFIHIVIAPYLFSVGSAGIAVCYLTLPIKDFDFRHKRLHRYNVMAGILMIIASALMFMNRKEWIICLTIAALFQLYTAFISPKEKS